MMKTFMKRIAAVFLTVVMAMGLCVNVKAEDTHTLTVTGDTLANKTVYAVKMFSARVTTSEQNIFDSYILEDSWLEFFKAESSTGGIGKDTINAAITDSELTLTDVSTNDDWKEAARLYLESLAGEDGSAPKNRADFAHNAQKWVRSHSKDSGSSSEMTFNTLIKNATASDGTAVFTGLSAGYYLVYPEGGSTGTDNRETDAMLVNVPTNGNADVEIKSVYPTVDKQVNTGSGSADNGSAQVGDVVTFTLTSTVPDMSDYTTYYFAFIDTLTKGLDLVDSSNAIISTGSKVPANTVSVSFFHKDSGSGQETEYEVNANFTVSYTTTADSKKQLTVQFDDLKQVQSENQIISAGDKIVVTYNAMINQEAAFDSVGTAGEAENSVKLEYSNDPNTTGKGESQPDVTKVYTYDIDVHKYTGDWNNDSTSVLAGATFVLSTIPTAPVLNNGKYQNVLSLYIVMENQSYRVATPAEISATADNKTTQTFTTNNSVINISGLEAGTYYLHEISAPSGYNKLTKPIEIKIEPTVSGDEPNKTTDYSAPVYTVNSESQNNDNTVAVKNTQGITLPETGSIGTIGLTALGVIVIAFGLFAGPRAKRNH